MLGLPLVVDVPLRGIVLACVGLAWVIVLVRLVGLRSFSKMTAFDFVVTLAVGSLLASAAAATGWAQLIQALVAIAALLVAQVILASSRRVSSLVQSALKNKPLLLMRHGEFIEDALASSRVSKQDVFAKIRQANVLSVAAVSAVVLETTGDISVLSGGEVDPTLIAGTRSP